MPTGANIDVDKAFFKAAKIYTVVPESSDARISDVLANAAQDNDEEHPLLLPIKERSLLFFGEAVLLFRAILVSYLLPDTQMS